MKRLPACVATIAMLLPTVAGARPSHGGYSSEYVVYSIDYSRGFDILRLEPQRGSISRLWAWPRSYSL